MFTLMPVAAFAGDSVTVEETVTDGSGPVVAKIGSTTYSSLQLAIKEAAPSGTVDIVADVTVDEWIMISEDYSIGTGQFITVEMDGLTINGNGHSLTVKSVESAKNGDCLFQGATELNVNDLTINMPNGASGISLKSGVINDVTFNGGVYGVFPKAGDITIQNCTFNTNADAIYSEAEIDKLVVKENTFNQGANVNVILLRGDIKFTDNIINSGRTVNVVSGSPVVTGNDFNNVRFKVYNEATATITGNEINTLEFKDDTKVKSNFGGNTLGADAQALLLTKGLAFNVTFNSDGGSAVAAQVVENAEKVTEPADPTKDGFTFEGWYVGDEEYDFTAAVTGDLELTAKWEEKHVHVFDQQVTNDAYKATDASHTAKATYYYSCVCGEKGTETFEDGELVAHVYDKQVATDAYKATDATHTAKATYHYSCVCGAKGTDTFEYGDVVAHAYETKYDANGHWTECTCGDKTEAVAHIFDNASDTTCNDCAYTRTVSSGNGGGSYVGGGSSSSSSSNKTESSTTTTVTPSGSTVKVETETKTESDGTKVETETTTTTTTTGETTKVETTTETKTDGTVVETTTTTDSKGDTTTVEKTTETNDEGTKVETTVTTDAQGETATTVTATLDNGSAVTNNDETVKVEVTKVEETVVTKVEEAVAADETVEVVGTADNAVSVSATNSSTGAAQSNFVQPMSVNVPVDKAVLDNVTDTSKLTMAKVVTNEDGTTELVYMGGSYDEETGTFNAKVDEDGDYILVEKADLVKIELTIDDTTVKHNDNHHEMDVAPKINAEEGRTELPLRYLGEALGFGIEWNNNVVTITKGDTVFSMEIGKEIPGFGTPYIDSDRTMVSARYISEMLGANVIWDPVDRQVIVVK